MDDDTLLAQIRAQHDRALTRARLRVWSADPGAPTEPSRWAHVPLVQLIQEYNPTLHRKGPAKYVTGHEPAHTSSSGTCLVIWTDAGRWKCMSCGKGGDAVTWVMAIQGTSALAAMRYLAERFGAPQGWRPPRRKAAPAAPPTITVGQGRRALVMREGGR